MALVMLSLAFLVKERIFYKDDCPLLSCRDIRLMQGYLCAAALDPRSFEGFLQTWRGPDLGEATTRHVG
jgi:hypothetical protein